MTSATTSWEESTLTTNYVSQFTAGAGVVTEVGSTAGASQSGSVSLTNMGPNVVWVRSMPATVPSNGGTVNIGGIPLRPGDSVNVVVPTYPVTADTFVPAVMSIDTGATVAFNVEGS